MFDSGQRPTGTTKTVALLVMAFVFCPAILLASRPVGYVAVSLAIACSALCVVVAWINWKRSSQLSIATPENRAE